NDLQIDIAPQAHLFGVEFEDVQATLQIRPAYHDLPVKTASAEQGGVEDLRTVGGAEDDYPLAGIKTVHLCEQLVQRLFTLIILLDGIDPTRFAHGVQLIDEDDTGGFFLRLLKQIAYPRRAHTDEHFDKVRATQTEKGHRRFSCHGACQEGFPGARRTDQQDAFGNAPAKRGILLGVAQKIDNLL